jgi:hypothetical protein
VALAAQAAASIADIINIITSGIANSFNPLLYSFNNHL